jgi:hypothetical protein
MDEHDPGQGEKREPGGQRASLTELYEKMSRIFRENLERAGTLTEDAFERALKESREWAGRFKENYGEDINRVSEYIRRDWQNAIRFTRDQTRKSFDLDRLQVGVLGVLASLARSAGEQLEVFAGKINDRLTYKTGEIAGAGTLQCTRCEQVLTFEQATRIPPCPKCHHTTYRRSY